MTALKGQLKELAKSSPSLAGEATAQRCAELLGAARVAVAAAKVAPALSHVQALIAKGTQMCIYVIWG